MIKKLTVKEIKSILEKHHKWLDDEKEGIRANLSGADLRRANLRSADLRRADLSGADLGSANLSGANLRSADLSGADLSGADLGSADLSGANLRSANLSDANLRSADLSGANLRSADLRRADLSGADLSGADLIYQLCPEEGEFIAWKKVEDIDGNNKYILKLSIPKDAGRISTICSRKCRAEFVTPIEAYELDGNKCNLKTFRAIHKNEFIYKIGKKAVPDSFDSDPRIECSNGISFFITRKEAVDF